MHRISELPPFYFSDVIDQKLGAYLIVTLALAAVVLPSCCAQLERPSSRQRGCCCRCSC